jgi:hypothetical protein
MIAVLIFVMTFAALLQFCVFYCRSLIAAYRKVELSDQVREVTGIESEIVGGDEFDRLVQLVHLCPQRNDEGMGIQAVGAYYHLLNLLRGALRPVAPGLAGWAERERQNCSYFAAVALDRRIAYSRDLLEQQMADHA